VLTWVQFAAQRLAPVVAQFVDWCGAHVVRDCVYVNEQEQQAWAAEMADLRLRMAQAAAEWRQRGAPAIPAEERDAWVEHYFYLLASAFAAQPLPSAEDIPKRGGRRQQSPAKKPLDELLRRNEDGATAFCRVRGYLSTLRKQGHAMLVALAAVFAGHPVPVAWAPK
jgi:hypothetical protein